MSEAIPSPLLREARDFLRGMRRSALESDLTGMAEACEHVIGLISKAAYVANATARMDEINLRDAAARFTSIEDAVTVLDHISITDPSARPDTEDAANRVALALEYLRRAAEGTT